MQLLLLGTAGGILLIQSVYDIRRKLLPLWITLMGMCVGILLRLAGKDFIFEDMAGVIPGLCCLAFSKVSRQALGYGDGLLICMIGIYLGLEKTIGLCLWAFLLAGITALYLLVAKKKKGKQEMAFVPFLFIGYLLEVLLC